MPSDTSPNKGTRFKRTPFPWTGIAMTTTAVLDDEIAPDHILAKHDGGCSVYLATAPLVN